jgi:hypothetical protein
VNTPQTTEIDQPSTPERRVGTFSATKSICESVSKDVKSPLALLALVRLLARQAARETVRSVPDSTNI